MRRLILIVIVLAILIWLYIRYSPEKEAEYYTIARDPAWEQIHLLDKEANFLAFSDEVLSAIANEEHIVIYPTKTDYQNFFYGLDQNRFDGVLTTLLPPAQLQFRYLISDPYFLLGPVLLVNENSTVTSIKEMQGKTVGILRGASLVFDIVNYPSISFIPFDDAPSGLDSLVRKSIDGMIMDSVQAYSLTRTYYAGLVKIATRPLTKKGVRLLTNNNPNGKDLIKYFNEGLQKIIDNGIYGEILEKWDLNNALKVTDIKEAKSQ